MTPLDYWLVTPHLEGLGATRLGRWIKQIGSLHALFQASIQDLLQLGATPQQAEQIKNPPWKKAEADSVWIEKNECHVISLEDERYPILLKEIPDAPLLLYVRGDLSLLNQPQLAIVGSRNPTPVGRDLAEQFARDLAEAGLIITSGMALGVDAASHRGALIAKGKTIAVAGTGLQQVYPASHRKLAEEIIKNGALVSEFSPTTPARAQNFPMRNRVISGLSLGVLVIEAAVKSGSLITARMAMEQNREVFALPGSIHNPLARGCHQLIQQGAKLVETAQDILEELSSLHAVLKEKTPDSGLVKFDAATKKFLQYIGFETTPLDTILMRSGLTAGEVSSMLLSLELRGYVSLVSGGYVRKC